MKEKILYLILGILIGAVITAGIFLIQKDKGPQGGMDGQKPDFSDMSDEEKGDMMEKPNGEKNKKDENIASSDTSNDSSDLEISNTSN